MRSAVVVGVVLGVLATLATSSVASAAEPGVDNEIAWRPSWKRFQPAEYVLTGTLIAGTAAFILFGNPDAEPNWRGPILFDKGVRNGLRLDTPDGRRAAQTVGDAFYYGGLAYPFLVDVLAITLVAHQKPDVAAQMALIDAEAFAITGFLSFLSNATIRRERPYVRECGAGKPDQVFPSCEKGGQGEGFFSGHTAIAYTGAALTCSHHANLPLYGQSGVGGTITCIAMLAGATAGGTARVLADKHYATDVIVGAAIGLASGLLVPWFHYRGGGERAADLSAKASPLRVVSVPLLSLDGGGVGAFGIF
jgi:membrane-associated phospholipid phosphatase